MNPANRRVLPLTEARTLWQTAVLDDTARAPVSLLLLAGLRPPEVAAARWDGTLLHTGRRLPVGRHCAAALEGLPRTTGPLLPHLAVVPLVQLVRAVGHTAGLDVGAPDLRHAAIRACFDAHLPAEWICGYFGTAPPRGGLPDGWADEVAGALDAAFT
jgi:integrase